MVRMDAATTHALGERIASLAAEVDSATHALLTCIRAFDESQGWYRQGALSCAHWLSWRIGLLPGAAREKVRVARALGGLSLVDAALRRGALSYSKVRAITRVATAATEERLLAMATEATGAQLERICRGFALAERSVAGRPADLERWVTTRPTCSGMVRLEAQLAPDEAVLVMKAIDAVRARGAAVGIPAGTPEGLPPEGLPPEGLPPEVLADDRPSPARAADERSARWASRADGLVTLAREVLAAADAAVAAVPPAAGRLGTGGDSVTLLVHVAAAPAGGVAALVLEDGTAVSAETLRRLACDAGIVPVLEGAHGETLDVGRRRRTIPPAIRRALARRDGGCRFPGCTNRRFVDAHHVRHWLHGGATRLDNLVLLCPAHHRRVHEEGFILGRDATGALVVRAPGGMVLPPVPPLSPPPSEPAPFRSPPPPPPWTGEPVDYDWAVRDLWLAEHRA
jgi:hypothetical protein